jgi:Kef-type K+ transport system membrane component KefB
MTDQQVQLLLADLALVILLARLLGAAAKRIGQPPVLGEIIAGILLGPTLWHGTITATLFPAAVKLPLGALANLGLVLFMFVVGYEVDLRLIRGRERVAASVSLSSIIVPLALGAVLGVWLAHHQRQPVHHVTTFVLFIGIAMSVTAFPVLARILTDRGLHRTRIGGLALASAAVDDVVAWSLLAVVVAIAGTGGNEWRLALAPVYLAVMFLLVRPGLRKLAGIYQGQGRLTPSVLAAVLIGLLLSACATDWMGVKSIFGAFLFGIAMPREGFAALREDILESLEQVTVLVLLPVFFVVSGLNVNLSTIGLSGLADLGLIMAVAIGGKFGGAFAGGRLAGVRPRQAGVLAALMNTRGLTEIVILSVGLQLGILDRQLYSLMVVMAIGTTAMAGPLLKAIYPRRIMQHDLDEADRALLGEPPPHRILVLIDRPETAAPLVDVGAGLAASRPHSELVLSHLVAHRSGSRLEVGTGLGGELLQLTHTMGQLQALAARAEQRGMPAVVQSRFSDDVTAELPGYVAAAAPDTIVLGPGRNSPELLGADGTTQLVMVLGGLPEAPDTVAVRWARGLEGAAALQVAAQLAVANRLHLVMTPGGGRRAAAAADLTRRGIAASDGPPPAGALLVAAADDGSEGAHLAVLAGSKEGSDDLDQWAPALDGSRIS